jgi:hypothetical protein
VSGLAGRESGRPENFERDESWKQEEGWTSIDTLKATPEPPGDGATP